MVLTGQNKIILTCHFSVYSFVFQIDGCCVAVTLIVIRDFYIAGSFTRDLTNCFNANDYHVD